MIVRKAVFWKNLSSKAIPWAHNLLLKTERHDGRTAVSGRLRFCVGQHRRLQTGGCRVAWRPGFNKVWMIGELLFQRRPYVTCQGEGSKTLSSESRFLISPSVSSCALTFLPTHFALATWSESQQCSGPSASLFSSQCFMGDPDLGFGQTYAVAATTWPLRKRYFQAVVQVVYIS